MGDQTGHATLDTVGTGEPDLLVLDFAAQHDTLARGAVGPGDFGAVTGHQLDRFDNGALRRTVHHEDECLKIACAFGAGMGKQQHVCGAVTGALMVLGARFGKALNDAEHKKELTYKKTEEFIKKFELNNGSIHCFKLLNNLNMNIVEDEIKIHELGLYETVCESAIKDAVELIEKLIYTE